MAKVDKLVFEVEVGADTLKMLLNKMSELEHRVKDLESKVG